MARPASGNAKGTFNLSGHTFVTVYDFMGQKLGLKGSDLAIYARIFGFHQAGRNFYESKSSTASFFGISDRAVFDAVSRLKAKGLIDEVAPCPEAMEIGSKCYRPAYGPLAEAGVLPNRFEEASDEGISPPEGTSGGGWGAHEESSDQRPGMSEESSEPHMNDVHPISKTDNRFFE